MTTTQTVPLKPNPEDLATFASDLAQLGSFTSRDLAEAYLDQNLHPNWQYSFSRAVKLFEPTCRYYT